MKKMIQRARLLKEAGRFNDILNETVSYIQGRERFGKKGKGATYMDGDTLSFPYGMNKSKDTLNYLKRATTPRYTEDTLKKEYNKAKLGDIIADKEFFDRALRGYSSDMLKDFTKTYKGYLHRLSPSQIAQIMYTKKYNSKLFGPSTKKGLKYFIGYSRVHPNDTTSKEYLRRKAMIGYGLANNKASEGSEGNIKEGLKSFAAFLPEGTKIPHWRKIFNKYKEKSIKPALDKILKTVKWK